MSEPTEPTWATKSELSAVADAIVTLTKRMDAGLPVPSELLARISDLENRTPGDEFARRLDTIERALTRLQVRTDQHFGYDKPTCRKCHRQLSGVGPSAGKCGVCGTVQ